MAVAEHMYLDKPAHAVSDSAVNLAHRSVRVRPWIHQCDPAQDHDPHFGPVAGGGDQTLVRGCRTGRALLHPEWIIRAFRDVLGSAELTAPLEQDNVPPRVTLAARPARLGACTVAGEPTPWSPGRLP